MAGLTRRGGNLIAVALLLAACTFPSTTINLPGEPPPDGDVPPPTSPITGEVITTPDPNATPVPPPTPVGVWQPIVDFPAGSALEVTAVSRAGDGFVAVGYQPMPGEGAFGRQQGVVWRSADGLTWQMTIDPGLQFVLLDSVVALGDTIYASGEYFTCPQIGDELCEEPADAGSGIWRSVSGATWERVALDPAMTYGIIDGLVATSAGIAAFGVAGDEVGSATVWTSTDGSSWSSTTGLAGMETITAIAQGPAGLVAFGTRYDETIDDIVAVVATSADGSQFTPGVLENSQGTSIDGLLAASDGSLVGVGFRDLLEGNFGGVTVRSTDGSSWTEGTASDDSFGSTQVQEIEELPSGGYIALGFSPEAIAEFNTVEGRSWVSTDGVSWRSFGPAAGVFSTLDGAAIGPAGMIVFTVTQEELDEELTSSIGPWFAPTAELTTQ